MNEDLKKELHDFRKAIDANIQKAESLKNGMSNSNELRAISLSKTKLEEGKMWVGKTLEAIGSELPKEFQHNNLIQL